MFLRLALGDVAPDPLWYRDYMDYTGPILMMMVLVLATYFSRSLVPAGMAVTLMVILFPELRANLRQTFPCFLGQRFRQLDLGFVAGLAVLFSAAVAGFGKVVRR